MDGLSTLRQVPDVGERKSPKVIGVPVRVIAVEMFVTNGQARTPTGGIKSERDQRTIFGKIRKARESAPVAVLQESLALYGEDGAAVPIGPPVQLADKTDLAAGHPLRLDMRTSHPSRDCASVCEDTPHLARGRGDFHGLRNDGFRSHSALDHLRLCLDSEPESGMRGLPARWMPRLFPEKTGLQR